jgi:hypothetical protein
MRELLLLVEEQEKSLVRVRDFAAELSEEDRHHLQLLVDAQYLRAISSNMMEAWVGPSAPVLRPSNAAGLRIELTGAGHDYLDAIRDDGIWQQTKEAVAETGGSATLEILKSLAIGLLKKKIAQHTGIEL